MGDVEVVLYSFLDLELNISRQLHVSAALSSVFTELEAGLCLGPFRTGIQVSCPCWESN